MYKFSKKSALKIEKEATTELSSLLYRALKLSYLDFGIGTIHRGKAAQNKAYNAGNSKVKYPNGQHNKMPSNAGDLFAYMDGKITYNMNYYLMLAGTMFAAFKQLQTEGTIGQDKYLRWGGDWDLDTELLTDQSLDDGMHFEIRKKKA